MSSNNNTYGSYYASNSQQHSNQGYGGCTTSRQTPTSSDVGFQQQTPTASQSDNYSNLSRFQYQPSNSASFTAPNSNGAWYSTSNTNSAPSYPQNYDSSSDPARSLDQRYQGSNQKYRLGNLAYASSLKSGSRSTTPPAQHQTAFPQPQQQHQQQRSFASPQTSSFPQSVVGHKQARPDSVNSVASNQSGTSTTQRNDHSSRPTYGNYDPSTSRNASYASLPRSPLNLSPQTQTQTSNTEAPSYGYQRHATRHGSTGAGSSSSKQQQQTSVVEQTGGYSADTQPQPQPQHQLQQQDRSSAQPSTPVTVDPTQIYDPALDLQRQAAKREAEAKRKEAEAAQKEEEARKQAEAAQHAKGVEEAQRLAREGAKTQQKRGNPKPDAPKKPRKSKKSAPTAPATNPSDADASAAAMTLVQTANSAPSGNNTDLEAQMKAMFLKMREFNEKDPALLSRLWHQEHETHMQTIQEQEEQKKRAEQQPKQKAQAKPSPGKRSGAKVKSAASKATPTPSQSQPKENAPSQSMQVNGESTSQDKAPPPASPAKTSGATVWPADKKASLAASAAKLIMQMPPNKGKTITDKEIAGILDTNPSYVDLCKVIESRDFQLDRSSFAKALLSAVPSVNKNNNSPPTAQKPSSTASQPPTPAATNGQRTMDIARAHLMNGANVVATPKKKGGRPSKEGTSPAIKHETPKSKDKARQRSPLNLAASQGGIATSDELPPAQGDPGDLEGLEAVKSFVDRADVEPPSTAPKPAKASRQKQPKPSLPPMPQTKEELARKRTFGDLVDLTQLSDTEIMPPSKRPSINGVKPLSSDQSQQQQHQQPPQVASQAPMRPQPVNSPVPPLLVPTHNHQTLPNPQPAHFSHPTQDSQLSSAQAPPLYQIPKDHPIRNIQVVGPLDRHKAMRRSTYNPKTIARDVLLASGRHPDMRHLNAHLDTLRVNFPSLGHLAPVDLSTFRWDMVDVGGPPPGSGAQLGGDLADDAGFEADDDSDTDSMLGESARGATTVTTNNGTSTAALPATPGSGLSRTKAKGRLRLSEPAAGARRHTGGNPTLGEPSSSKPPRQSANTPSTAPKTGGGYAALRAAQSNSTEQPVKRKGRPIGWRKYMQKNPPAEGSSNKPARAKGLARESKKPNPQPNYQVYRCRWTRVLTSNADGFKPPGKEPSFKECTAELHNLATLRKHVHKLHLRKDAESGKFKCHWESCGRATAVRDGPRTVSRIEPIALPDEDAWRTHVEDEHIKPIAWELGDGPQGGVSDREASEVSDAYLSDRVGRRVTPRVPMPDGENAGDEADAQHPPRAVIRPGRSSPTAQEKARLEEWEVQERRRRMGGPGIDRAGSTMATDKRRRGFVDDEGDVQIISDDEG